MVRELLSSACPKPISSVPTNQSQWKTTLSFQLTDQKRLVILSSSLPFTPPAQSARPSCWLWLQNRAMCCWLNTVTQTTELMTAVASWLVSLGFPSLFSPRSPKWSKPASQMAPSFTQDHPRLWIPLRRGAGILTNSSAVLRIYACQSSLVFQNMGDTFQSWVLGHGCSLSLWLSSFMNSSSAQCQAHPWGAPWVLHLRSQPASTRPPHQLALVFLLKYNITF